MSILTTVAVSRLDALRERNRLRTLQVVAREGSSILHEGKHTISFACNDYLGLSSHPEVQRAAIAAIEKYGTGAGASRLVTGNHPLLEELEAALAAIKYTESACVFGSGYLANIGTIPAFVGKGDLVLADRASHACMHAGMRLSGATIGVFRHNDLTHLAGILARKRARFRHCLVLTESVFSMDGDRAPLEAIRDVTQHQDAWLMVDDAHGFGVGNAPAQSVDLWMGTLSKAAGSYGGYVCAARPVVEWLKTSARSLMFSTALPPASAAAALAAVRILGDNPHLRALPLQKARKFTDRVGLPEAQSAIVPIIVEGERRALEMSEALKRDGFWVPAIRPPSVPEGTSRLRFTFSALHQDTDIDRLADAVRGLQSL